MPTEPVSHAQSVRRALFDPEEYAGRMARLRERMKAAGVEAALFDEIESLTWLTGYGNSENRWRCVVVPLEGEPFIVIRALDATPCRQRTWIEDVFTFRDWEDPFLTLQSALDRRRLSRARIGLDFNSYGMPLARFARMSQVLSGCEFVDLGPVIWELRLIKSPAEMAFLRQSAAVADAAMERAVHACRPGASQRDAAREAAAAFIELGADPGPPGPISAAQGWDFLHGHLSSEPLAPGQSVHIELVPRVQGYSARLMRCVSIGEPDAALQAATRRLIECQDRQIAAMRPGAQAAAVDAILREGLLTSGLREQFDNISGYTLGFYAAAGPRTSDFTRIFHPEAQWSLEPGMVFHLYASAAGASISETVEITPEGPLCLSRLPRQLFVRP